jgi:hypothetical protein
MKDGVAAMFEKTGFKEIKKIALIGTAAALFFTRAAIASPLNESDIVPVREK